MAKFKQVPQAYLFNKLMGFWGNMVKNYRSDVLMIAYVRSQTCFSWPCRVEDRDKTAKIGFAA